MVSAKVGPFEHANYSWDGLHGQQCRSSQESIAWSNLPTLLKLVQVKWDQARVVALGILNTMVPLFCYSISDIERTSPHFVYWHKSWQTLLLVCALSNGWAVINRALIVSLIPSKTCCIANTGPMLATTGYIQPMFPMSLLVQRRYSHMKHINTAHHVNTNTCVYN